MWRFKKNFFFNLRVFVCLFVFKFLINLFIYLWLCWVFVSLWGLSLVVAGGGHSSSRCTGLSLSRPLLLRSTGSRRAGSVIVAHGPSCSAACGIFPDQGLNPCPLHWQADSQPLRHQGSPHIPFLKMIWLVPAQVTIIYSEYKKTLGFFNKIFNKNFSWMFDQEWAWVGRTMGILKGVEGEERTGIVQVVKGNGETGDNSVCSQLCSEVAIHSSFISLFTFESNLQQV